MPSTQWTVSIDGSIQRYLGDSELAFYLQSRPDGIGDMFTHVGLNAPSHYFTPERVCIAWAILRASHALMQCTVLNLSNDERPKYSFIPPKDMEDALSEANRALSFSTLSKEELIDNCLNGPRTLLSDEHLSHLTISQTDHSIPEFQVIIYAPHFTGDGTCLELTGHQLIAILSSPRSNHDLRTELRSTQNILPPPLESMLPSLAAPWKRAISSVNFLQCQQREIGNHTLPRVQNNNSVSVAKKTRFIVHLFNEQDTRVIIQLCKAKGVSVNNAILALCAVSWARMKPTHSGENLMPILLYTAINMRNLLPKTVDTFWFLALTYYTISLPSYPPNSPLAFWHRASMAKEQTTRAVKSKLLLNRASLIAANRAKASSAETTKNSGIKPQLPPHARVDPPAPSRALLGLSLLGNLDSLYKQSDYSPQVKLLSFRGASKLKKGGLLFLAQTFRNQLEFHLVWEETGFEEGIIEKWWEGVITGSHTPNILRATIINPVVLLTFVALLGGGLVEEPFPAEEVDKGGDTAVEPGVAAEELDPSPVPGADATEPSTTGIGVAVSTSKSVVVAVPLITATIVQLAIKSLPMTQSSVNTMSSPVMLACKEA